MLLELLAAVSGYPSSIDPGSLNHPSEVQVLQRSQEFGEKVAYISDHCFKLGGPIVETLQKMLYKFYDLVVDLEAQVYDGTLEDMCAVIALTVDPYERLFTYCCDLIKSQAHLDAKVAVQLRRDQYSGFAKIAEIAASCLKAIDQYYVNRISPWLLWGITPDTDILYPDFPDCSAIAQNIGDCLRVIDTSACHAEFSDFTDFAHEALQTLRYPLEHGQFKQVLVSIQQRLDSHLLPLLHRQLQIDDLLVVLHKVLLCGSSLFCMCFAESRPIDFTTFDPAHLKSALALYYEDVAEISPEQLELAQSLLDVSEAAVPAADHEFTDVLTAANLQVEVTAHQRFQQFLTSSQGDVYGAFFFYLLSIWAINDSLKKPGIDTFIFKQFFNILWAHFQKVITETMRELRILFSSVSLPLIPGAHTTLLKKLGSRLLLDNQMQRMQIKLIMLDACSVAQGLPVEKGSIHSFVRNLATHPQHVELSLALQGLLHE